MAGDGYFKVDRKSNHNLNVTGHDKIQDQQQVRI